MDRDYETAKTVTPASNTQAAKPNSKAASSVCRTHSQSTCWKTIEREYRAGHKPLRRMGAENGITEGAIRKRARRDGWARTTIQKAKNVPMTGNSGSIGGYVYAIYFHDSSGQRFVKIGKSTATIERLSTHQTSNPFDLFIACSYYSPDARREEARLHEMFSSKRVNGEWFVLSDDDLRKVAEGALLI